MCACGCEVKQPQMEKTCSPLFIMKKLLPFGRFEARTKVTGGLTCCFSLCSGCVLHAILHEIHLIMSFKSLKKVLQNWLCIWATESRWICSPLVYSDLNKAGEKMAENCEIYINLLKDVSIYCHSSFFKSLTILKNTKQQSDIL